MADRMHPPGSAPGVAIVIGAKPSDSPSGRMPPPGGKPDAGGGKVSPEEAGVIRSDEHCIDCQMYHPDTGECDKVDGSFDPQDSCDYFLAIEPDEDDEGGPSDNDEDDQMAPSAGGDDAA